jgi:hypothetical protein
MKHSWRLATTFLVLTISANLAFSQSKKAVPKEPAPNCFISEFRHIGLSVHDPIERAKQAQLWLVQNVSACNVEKLEQNNHNETEILDEFKAKFGEDMINSLKNMGDFYLFEFTPFYGEAVFGFGKAYNLGGENFDEFVQRQSNGHTGHGKLKIKD